MVADALGIGVSSIKRWTDDGQLKSTRTAGGHRRYRLEDIYAFAWENDFPTDGLPPLAPRVSEIEPGEGTPLERLVDALRDGDRARADSIVRRELAEAPDRAIALDRIVGAAMKVIGDLWHREELGVDEEHRATGIVEEILTRLSAVKVPEPAGSALLACPPGEQHDLPLRFVRLILEWSDWEAHSLGADVPWDALIEAVSELRPNLVLLSARSSEPFDSVPFMEVLRRCDELGIDVAVGGHWARGGPESPTEYRRFRTLKGFENWLRSRGRNG